MKEERNQKMRTKIECNLFCTLSIGTQTTTVRIVDPLSYSKDDLEFLNLKFSYI